MHIDHQQFLELLTEASGLDAETTEKQLNQLIKDVQQSLDESEAYEIEGFGIFSSLGNRVMFIPSKELETEINFKYVGMEPIELDEPSPSFVDPFDGLEDDESDGSNEIDVDARKPIGKDLSTRFAGLIDDDIKDPDLEPAEDPGPEMWGVEAHKEDESADRLFASLMGQDYEKPSEEKGEIDASEDNSFDGFENIFDESDNDTGSEALDEEVAAFMEDDSSTGIDSEEKTTDELLDDVFADMESGDSDSDDDDDDDFFKLNDDSDTVIDYAEVPNDAGMDDDIISIDLNSISAENEAESEDSTIDSEEEALPEFKLEDEHEEAEAPEKADNDMDFEDPFLDLEDDQVDESLLRMEEFDDTEIIPVIKNITTDDPTEAKKEEEKAEEPVEKPEKKKKVAGPKEPTPMWLWIVLVLVIVGGGIIGLGYFNILNIPFISSNSSEVATTSQPASPPPAVQTPPAETNTTNEGNTTQPAQTTQPVEQPAEPVVENTPPAQNTTSNDVAKYGLTGTLSEAGMDGYTIIMFSLSNRQNAYSEQQKLQNNGYRAIVMPIESERYGTLWRVSLGQFASLFDAAVAAEEIETLLPDNYFIKKIN